jgi:hypothetical protein
MNAVKRFDVCPRCRNDWAGRLGYHCVHCDLDYYVYVDTVWLKRNGLLIHWNYGRMQCQVAIGDKAGDNKSYVVPWLPFNVSDEELGKYLVLV